MKKHFNKTILIFVKIVGRNYIEQKKRKTSKTFVHIQNYNLAKSLFFEFIV